MAASSVTGKGHGAGYSNKGPHNGRDVYVPLNSPHIVAAGSATLVAGTKVVTFATSLNGDKAGYVIMLTPQSATTTVARITATTNDGNGNFSTFTITGGTTDVVAWAAVNVGPGDSNLV